MIASSAPSGPGAVNRSKRGSSFPPRQATADPTCCRHRRWQHCDPFNPLHTSFSRYPQLAATAISSMSSLQRLRQGQGRCQQQLLSLLQWHQQQTAAAALGGAQQSRGWADKAAAVQFAKQRKGFENSLSELRKQWAQQRLEKEATAAAAAQAARWVHWRRRLAAAGGAWLVGLSVECAAPGPHPSPSLYPPACLPACREAREALKAQRAQQDIADKASRQTEYAAALAAERELRVGAAC